MKSLFSLVVFMSTVFIGNVYADAKGPDANQFINEIETYRNACANGCQAPFKNEDALARLNSDAQTNLKDVAVAQAQVWGDTILEGDYYSDGQTRLDSVRALYDNEQLIGYKISYSERAWYTGECSFDGSDEAALKNCQEGRIQESTYVSPDFATYFRDEDQLADFKN